MDLRKKLIGLSVSAAYPSGSAAAAIEELKMEIANNDFSMREDYRGILMRATRVFDFSEENLGKEDTAVQEAVRLLREAGFGDLKDALSRFILNIPTKDDMRNLRALSARP
ncbi:MAG: hypothetical protein AAB355_03075 [Patescibacteria group bacterium]